MTFVNPRAAYYRLLFTFPDLENNPKPMKRSTFFALSLLGALLVLSLAACDSSAPGGSETEAPTPIASSAFAFDNTFPEQNSFSENEYENFTHAVARVGVVSAVIGVHLVVPAKATGLALQAEPFVEDGIWIWENTATVDGVEVTARLEGTPDGTTTEWRMLVSAEDFHGHDFDDFVLYEATTTLAGGEGSWSLFYRIEGTRTRVLDADFSIISETEAEITFEAPETHPNPDARGATVLYASDGTDRLFDWHEPTEGRTHLVGWDAETHTGYIEAWNFNEGVRACWDATLQNTECVTV